MTDEAWHQVAVLAMAYHWSPRDAMDLTWSEVAWWGAHLIRMKGEGHGSR